MSRRCELTGVGPMVGHNVSHSNIKTKRRFMPNLNAVKLASETLGQTFSLRITNAALRTIDSKGGFDAVLVKARDEDLSAHRWTVDDARDLAFVREVYGRLATARGALGTASNGVDAGPPGAGTAPSAMHLMPFGMRAVLDLLQACPGLAELNSGTRRNEGLERSRLADRAAAKAYGA